MQVSVIIPVYNGAATLDQTLASFLRQRNFSAKDAEIILCDDGSEDNSREILRRYAGHPQVRVLHQDNRG